MENKKYTQKYIEKYGVLNCMSKWDIKSPYSSVEEVYKDALKKGVTWQELLNFRGYKKEVLL